MATSRADMRQAHQNGMTGPAGQVVGDANDFCTRHRERVLLVQAAGRPRKVGRSLMLTCVYVPDQGFKGCPPLFAAFLAFLHRPLSMGLLLSSIRIELLFSKLS